MKTLEGIEKEFLERGKDGNFLNAIYRCRQAAKEWVKLIEEYEQDDDKIWYCLTCGKDCTEGDGTQWTPTDECKDHVIVDLSTYDDDMKNLIKHIFNLGNE